MEISLTFTNIKIFLRTHFIHYGGTIQEGVGIRRTVSDFLGSPCIQKTHVIIKNHRTILKTSRLHYLLMSVYDKINQHSLASIFVKF